MTATRSARSFLRPLARLYRRALTVGSRLAFERGPFDTAIRVPLDELGLGDPDREAYEPSGWLFLRRALPPREVRPEDVFLDYGSGLGRVVYLAARDYRFGRVIGVDISDELNSRARHNIDRNRRRLRCHNVQFVTADALTYRIPDDVTVVYMFNPFGGDVFRAAVDAILSSLDRAPRSIRFVYTNPMMEDYLAGRGRFELVRRVPIRRRRTPFKRPYISVYRVGGPATS